jgi:hypothetical protein
MLLPGRGVFRLLRLRLPINRFISHSSHSNPVVSTWCPEGNDVQTPDNYDLVRKMFSKYPSFTSIDLAKEQARRDGRPTSDVQIPDHLKMGPYYAKNKLTKPHNISLGMFENELCMLRSRIYNATNYNLLVRIAEWLTVRLLCFPFFFHFSDEF